MILNLLCFSPHNLNQHYITWHQICLHLFKNHKLVPGCFLIFFTACLFVYSNSEYQMTLIILLIKYSRIFYTLSYWLMFKIYFPQSQQNVVELNTNMQIILGLFSTIYHFHTFYRVFFPVRSMLFILIVAPVTSMLLVSFKEAYMASVTDICSVSLSIPSLFGT